MEDPAAYDPVRINLCGKPVEFKLIRTISPLIPRDRHTYEVVIDETVYGEFYPRQPTELLDESGWHH